MKIQLKRSDVLAGGKAKEPTPGNMKDGELAINYSALDPSFFIKDSNGTIRKLGINDATNVQSDWAESNPSSPAYIKNKQLVTQELSDLQDQIDLKIEDAPDNKQYGRVKGAWTLIEVLEAAKDGNGYVRKDGDWYAITEYGYATTAYVDSTAQTAGNLALTLANEYTDQKILEISGVIDGQGFVTEAPDDSLYIRQGPALGETNGSWQPFPAIVEEARSDGIGYVRFNEDWENVDDYLTLNTDFLKDAEPTGQIFGRQNNQWVEIIPPDAGVTSFNGRTGLVLPQSGDYSAYYTTEAWVESKGYITASEIPTPNLDGYVTTNTNQTISGNKLHTGDIQFGSTSFALTPASDGFLLRRDGFTGSCGNKDGGLAAKWSSGNLKVGIRAGDNPSVALTVCSSIRASQYQNENGTPIRSTFDGQMFTLEGDGEFYFENPTVFHDTVIQESPTIFRIPETSAATTTTAITSAERLVANRLRQALRGVVTAGKRAFSIDKQTLVSAFTDEGLDINDYSIIEEVNQGGHPGFTDADVSLNVPGVAQEAYTAVDYQSLFAFCLAAGPDLSALETRLAALETAIAVDGYYPLYTTEAAADANGNGTSHSHTFYGITYYMPNGVTYYHGNYVG